MNTFVELERARKEWLDSLREGDKVVVACQGLIGSTSYQPARVERVTKTRVVVAGKIYNRDGYVRGQRRSWSTPRLEPYTDAVKLKIETEQLRYEVDKIFKIRDLDLQALREVKATLDALQARTKRT